MEDFSKIGLLDFQSRGGHFAPLFSSFSQNNGYLPLKEQSCVQYNQNADLDTAHESKPRNTSSKVKTCNLDELLSSCSLMYVSGDSQGLDSSKLQLELCTRDCCNSRVKYARVHRDKLEQDIWSNNNRINSFNSVAPLPGPARSSWDLGSDGASTPGSNSWGDMFGVGPVGPVGQMTRTASQWPSSADLGRVWMDNTPHMDTWAACDALLETDKAFGEDDQDYNDHWSQFSKKSRKPKL